MLTKQIKELKMIRNFFANDAHLFPSTYDKSDKVRDEEIHAG